MGHCDSHERHRGASHDLHLAGDEAPRGCSVTRDARSCPAPLIEAVLTLFSTWPRAAGRTGLKACQDGRALSVGHLRQSPLPAAHASRITHASASFAVCVIESATFFTP